MTDWQPIETEPLDGNLIEVKYENGTLAVCPSALRREPSHAERLAFAKMGEWPDHKNWKITHWRSYE